MPTTPEQIDRWRGAPSESQHLEFKAARTGFDSKKLYRYCVAIANEGGGHLILGVGDKPPRTVVGTQACSNPVGMAAKLFEMLKFRVDVEVVNHRDGRVVVYHIPSRPTGTAYHFDGAYLMRAGEELVPMSEDQLRGIFAEGEPEWLEQATITGISGQEVVDLLDTQAFFDLLGLPYPSTREEVLFRLKTEQLVDDKADGLSIRRLGGILLAKSLARFPDLERKAPRVVVYEGNDKRHTRLDQTGAKGYSVGFQGLVDFIMAQLPQNEVIEDAIRKQVKLVPEIVIRELVANALIHQEFAEGGMSVMIEVYENRLEITNPGEPVVPVERFIDGYQSRNERLAGLMRRMGICEEKSSGVDQVVAAAEAFQLPPPDFRTTHNRTSVVIAGPKEFASMDRDERIRACYQHCVLRYVTHDRMTNQSLRERFHLPEGRNYTTSVSQVIAASVDDGLVKPDDQASGSRKYAKYVPFWA